MGQRAAKPLVFLGRAEYRRWAETQASGRFERIGGEVVAMAPERAAHMRVKLDVRDALRSALRAAGLPCEAMGDGMTVEVGDDTDYEPDALVNCGPRVPGDAVAAPNPVVVVEVLSPSTRSVDSGAKLTGYFQVPSVQHYLVVRADRRLVTHHARRADGGIETSIRTSGALRLDPPCITVSVEDFYLEEQP